jgi:hypothetical protein
MPEAQLLPALFLCPTWLWGLWHFCGLAFEMEFLLLHITEDHPLLEQVKKSWKAFTGNLICFMFAFLGSGIVCWQGISNALAPKWLLYLFAPIALYVVITRQLEKRLLIYKQQLIST